MFNLMNIKIWQDWPGQIGNQCEKVIGSVIMELQGSGVRDKARESRCIGSTGEKRKKP